MPKKIPETTIDEILKRTDIVDLIGSYLSLKQAGKDHVGLCPFHNEKTPSFSVSPPKTALLLFRLWCRWECNSIHDGSQRNEFHRNA